jgi:hypothetical protein
MKTPLFHVITWLLLGTGAALPVWAQSDGQPRGVTQLPYLRYEAEAAVLGSGASLQQSPQFIQSDIASEASDQQYVSLGTNGASVEWVLTQPAQGVTVRFTLPDNSSGMGQSGPLNVYVNDVLVKTVTLSSYWAYQYFNGEDPQQTPGAKTFMRFDEVHFRLDNAVGAGSKIRLQKDNSPLTYGIDFVELEPVPNALPQPANYLSVTSYGATPDDQTDDFAAFNQCIAAAAAQGRHVYIPPGRFLLSDKLSLNVSNIKIQGAGVWYTEVYFSTDRQFYGGIMGRASNVEISHFYMNTANNDRLKYDEPNPRVPAEKYKIYKGFMGTYGANSYVHDIWVEHFECGFWLGGYDPPYPIDITTNMVISKCRIRNNYADGVNFCQGTSGSVVEQCSVRNNGDDALAIWPANAAGNNQTCRNNIFRNNTIEHTWRAGGIGIFGGTGHEVHHNLIKDGVAGSGIRFTNDFGGFTFEYPGTAIRVYENTINGCGTSYDLWNQKRGAVELYANTGIFNLQFDNNSILRSQRDGVQMYGNNIHHLVFNNTIIDGTGLDPITRDAGADVYGGFGLYVQANSQTATFNNLTVTNAESGTYINRNINFQLIIQHANIPVTAIAITAPAADTTLAMGQALTLRTAITPVDATNKNVTWSSSNPAAVTVDSTGKATAVGLGSALITVTTQSGSHTASRRISIVPGVNVTATDAAAAEGGNTAVFTISTQGITQNITVAYTLSGTAGSGDYNASPALTGSITLTPGGPSAAITISPVDDAIFEGPETLRLTLRPGTGYNRGGDTTAVITIADNDNPPCVSPVIAQVAGTAPVIDQTIEATWNTAPTRSISNVTLGSMPGDYSGRWRAMYDNTNLYLLVEVGDATRVNDSGGSWWEDDVIELFVDADNSKGASYDGVNDFQLGFRWNDNTIHVGGSSVNRTAGINFRQYATSNGYNLEAAIPWSTLGTTPALGKAIGLDVQVDDDDNSGSRDAQMASFATTGMAWSDPRLFGTVYLTSCSGNNNPPDPPVNDSAGKVYAARVSGTVTVNGSLSESAWSLGKTISKSTVGTPDNTASFGVLWDNNNLYIGVRVLDGTLYNDSPDAWDNDAVEIYIDANNNKLSVYDGRDNQLIKAYNGSGLFAKTALTGVQHAWAAIPGGYSVEISIPWSQLGVNPAADLNIGFDIGYDDDDNGGARDGQAVWYGNVNNYASTAGFGTLVLSGTTAAVSEMAPFVSNSKFPADEKGALIIAPNPAPEGQAKVSLLGVQGGGLLQVFNLQGKLVHAERLQSQAVLNLRNLPQGVYVVKYVTGNTVINSKLLIP